LEDHEKEERIALRWILDRLVVKLGGGWN
jgi:hypothetical protein